MSETELSIQLVNRQSDSPMAPSFRDLSTQEVDRVLTELAVRLKYPERQA